MAPIMLSLAGSLFLAYGFFALWLWRGLRRLSFHAAASGPVDTPFSILIPCRNDARTLRQTLQNIAAAREGCTGAWELLVIDDHSTPEEARALAALLAAYPENHRLLSHQGAPGKKAALQEARHQARYELIVQTDADAQLERGALAHLLAPFAQVGTELSFGTVRMHPCGKLASRFAALDYLSLQMSGQALAALGRPYMGSAANMAYRKSAVPAGEKAGREWQSGDDVFLMQALHRRKAGSVQPVPAAWATTPAPDSWGAFLLQRIRWGSKASAYPLTGSRFLALGIFLHSLGLGVLWGLAFIWPQAALYALLAHGAKVLMDGPLLRRYARATGQGVLMRDYAWVAALYPFYIILVTAIIALPFRWKWKGVDLKQVAVRSE